MPGTITPRQMFDHQLDIRKGWWDAHSLDYSIKKTAGEEFFAGSVGHADPVTGLFRVGLPDDYMPLYVRQSYNDFDVDGDVGNIIANALGMLVATGGFEVATTEFISDAYTWNDPLTVENAAADRGKVKKGTYYTDTICGICSDSGPKTNSNGREEIRFWTYFLPRLNPTASSSSSQGSSSSSSVAP